jgi:carboxypeptidase C (cathepsin A)
VDVDAAVFRDFVMTYVSVNNRASSPRFIYGESYGGPRTAVLADLLESAGTSLSGVVLQSPAMDYHVNCSVMEATSSCAANLPSYGAIGSWHGFSNPSPPVAQLPPFLQEVRGFVRTEYAPAVATFLATGVRPGEPMITRLADISGLARGHWAASPNRGQYFYRVNLQPGTVYGAYDGRVSIANNFAPGTEPDPSSTLIGPSFSQRIVQYLSTNLGYTTPSSYVMLSGAINTWNFGHDGRAVPDTIPDLASALAQNPRLKVLAVNGYHDIVTPFFVTEQDLERLGALPNVSVRNYVGGHMTYLESSSRRAMKADLADFYRSALEN